jgi:hypothetical protein
MQAQCGLVGETKMYVKTKINVLIWVEHCFQKWNQDFIFELYLLVAH